MKKFFIITFVIFVIAFVGIFSTLSDSNKVTGNAISKISENHPNNFYFLLGFLILVTATSAYFYSAKKYGPA